MSQNLNFANYPRGATVTGSLAELDALVKAYRTIGYAFLIMVAANASIFALTLAKVSGALVIGQAIAIAAAIWAGRTYANAVGAKVGLSVFLGVLSTIVPCMALVLAIVLQNLLFKRITQDYGIGRSIMGFKKDDLARVRASLGG